MNLTELAITLGAVLLILGKAFPLFYLVASAITAFLPNGKFKSYLQSVAFDFEKAIKTFKDLNI